MRSSSFEPDTPSSRDRSPSDYLPSSGGRWLFDSLVSTAGIFIVILDRSGNVESANEVFESLTGLASVQLRGRSFCDALIASEERDSLREVFASQVDGQLQSQGENTLVTAAGERRLVAWSSSLMEHGEDVRLAITGIDVTESRRAEEELDRRLEIEQLVFEVTARMLGLPSRRIDEGIDQMLELTGRFAGADRAYVFRHSPDGENITNTHEWCAEGVAPQIDVLADLHRSQFPWWERELEATGVVYVTDIDDIPPEGRREREMLLMQGISSVLAVDMSVEGRSIGFIGFDAVGVSRRWSPEDVRLLRMLARVAAGALCRCDAERELNQVSFQLEQVLPGLVEALHCMMREIDPEMADRGLRTSQLAWELAVRTGLTPEEATEVRQAALLVDIGRLVLGCSGADPCPDHPRKGYEILSKVPRGDRLAKLVLQHHESPDGTGFPLGLDSRGMLPGAAVIRAAAVMERLVEDGSADEEAAEEVRREFPAAPKALLQACRRLAADLASGTVSVSAET